MIDPVLKPQSLQQWLRYQQILHDIPIDLGLQRVGEVARRLGVQEGKAKVVTIGGTNGKGSCVTLMTSILVDAGYRVGSYTSPHILRYNERIRINRQDLRDEAICEAFEIVNEARDKISLSYFEFGTLAALVLFDCTDLDVIILEVGLGGRLDAVNIRDPDLALITSIGIDHVSWLGADRESIGLEKAGIMRPGISTVCGDPMPPRSIASQARMLGSPLYNIGDAYRFEEQALNWSWYGPQSQWNNLPRPAIEGKKQLQNAATVLMGLSLLNEQLPVNFEAIRSGLRNATLPGRFQRIHGKVETILDIAHNPEAAIALASTLKDQPIVGRTHAVFAVLSDKDAVGIVRAMQECVDSWYLTQVDSTRALPVLDLVNTTYRNMPDLRVTHFPDPTHAYQAACRVAEIGDRILVFGSVLTVAAVLDLLVKTDENTAALSMEKL